MEYPIHGSCSQPSTPRRSQNVLSSSSPPKGPNLLFRPSSSASSSPVRGLSSGSGSGSVSPTTGVKVNRFSKIFSSFKNWIAEAATIEPSSDVAPGVDGCCRTSRCHYGLPIHHLESEWLAFGSQSQCGSSPTSSSTSSPQVTSRLIVYRDCDRRGRKILFDSEHVSSDYVYQKPEDPKLLKQLGEYVFGCVPLASASSSLSLDCGVSSGHKRFCKWKVDGKFEQPNKTLYIWSKIFEMGSYNRSTKKDSATSDYSSVASEQSSSGYESGGNSTGAAGKTFSLPLFNPRLSSSPSNSVSSFSQTRSLPGRIDSYKTNLAMVWMLTQNDNESSSEGGISSNANNSQARIPFPYLSPLVEKLMLNPLSHITQKFYQNSDHFVTSLKNVSTSLSYDLRDFLGNHHVVNLSLVRPPLPDMVNSKLVCKFLELIFSNLDSSIVLNLEKWTEVKAILYFFKMVLRTCVCKCNLLDSRRDSLVETGTDVVVSVTNVHELDGVDSGIELEGSSSSRVHSVSTSSMYHQSGRKWSIVSEEGSDLGGEESSQDEGDCGHVSFHLGDADVDQSEAKLALGEVDLSRLKRDERRPSIESTASQDADYVPPDPNRPPLQVKLSLSDGKLKDACSAKYNPCYHCNGTYVTEHSRFNPYYYCQVLAKPGQKSRQVTYDMEYVSFMKIIELYGSGQIRHFNLSEDKVPPMSSSSTFSINSEDPETNDLSKKIKQFVEGYIQLAKVTSDNGKLDSFVTFQMEEIRDIL